MVPRGKTRKTPERAAPQQTSVDIVTLALPDAA
jgi:hypothetical protein